MNSWYKWRKLSSTEKQLLKGYAIFLAGEIPSFLQIVTFAGILGYLTTSFLVSFTVILIMWRLFLWARAKQNLRWEISNEILHPSGAKTKKEKAQVLKIARKISYYDTIVAVTTSVAVSIIVKFIIEKLPR